MLSEARAPARASRNIPILRQPQMQIQGVLMKILPPSSSAKIRSIRVIRGKVLFPFDSSHNPRASAQICGKVFLLSFLRPLR